MGFRSVPMVLSTLLISHDRYLLVLCFPTVLLVLLHTCATLSQFQSDPDPRPLANNTWKTCCCYVDGSRAGPFGESQSRVCSSRVARKERKRGTIDRKVVPACVRAYLGKHMRREGGRSSFLPFLPSFIHSSVREKERKEGGSVAPC
ncbi:uncharacterized protein LY79DRAFT_567088 [Colletotrichum navitas]|uniref:Uncharacterized protein n=1 Tax=Colletotrichum navitas TaxID=681940 RepID=A0AAD8V097_9PEZI|nr:uncharacterized protein LY79DRAFT_567088 [Colletotrichum navitas]KAK1574078.1 hypothetical protein LY79DRAFT_567088 [Colletotrichum navitas]